MVPRQPPAETNLVETAQLLDRSAMGRMVRRMAYEIVERVGPSPYLVGIRTGGAHLADRMRRLLEAEQSGVEGATKALAHGALDITLYRDDVFLGLPKPEVGSTELSTNIDGQTVVLVDDVLYTGRTIRAAMDVLLDYGRPRAIKLAVLIDRGWREFPIQADVVGLKVETTLRQSVRVMLSERGEDDRVVLREKGAA